MADLSKFFKRAAGRIDIIGSQIKYDLSGATQNALNKNRIQFLVHHSTKKNEEQQLRGVIHFLLKNHKFISYSEAFKRICEGRIDAPYMVFTFDDGYKEDFNSAKVLNEFGISGCFFVVSELIGEKDEKKVERICVENLKVSPTNFLDWADMEKMVLMGHEIGSHTATHRKLISLTAEEIAYEVNSSHRTLSARMGKIDHFAWPFGGKQDVSLIALKILEEAPFLSRASAMRGCHAVKGNPSRMIIRRNTIWNTIRIWDLKNSLVRSSLAELSEEGIDWYRDA